ncbi:hypothetical protein BLNAU_20193 [Blattamonas nauphoetae]|uniref:Uncharacterized protein n=1 Tax=Blattamonas nauphoetae TaxID=2049346 RepID=A0ABQ9WVA6_9EUKA|nr:hypothetical protein BLNAU_22418 [Blattamonas nauphoetae]KAK2944903.1 hypothetical protein BLNAU_20193 [Blattamonas nauphoetae]
MLVDEPPVHTNIDEEKAKQTICGDRILLRSAMLNSLLTLVTESDWALSTILDVEYIKPLEQYCEQTQPGDVQITLPKLLFLIEIALTALSTECKSDFATRSFLRKLEVSYPSTDSSSELVPFAGRLCTTLAEHVSEIKPLFTESSPSDGTVSALSATLPKESLLLAGNPELEIVNQELSLLRTLLITDDHTFINV